MATTEHLRAESRGIQQEEGEYTTRAALLDWAADQIDVQNKLIEYYRMYRQPPDSLLKLLDDLSCKEELTMTGGNAWVEDERELELPELTDEERQAIESVDMTPILGTYRERYKVAMDFAMRTYRKHRELKGHVRALLAMSEDAMITPESFGEWVRVARNLLGRKQ